MKAKSYSALQKTYDQSHLTCSTAVYYESKGNEVEALRCWRECLAQLHGHNSSGYRPRTETERALLQSLKTMEDQCHNRVELLEAILTSKAEAENTSQGWRNIGDDRMMVGAPKPLPTNPAHPIATRTPPASSQRSPPRSIAAGTLTQLARPGPVYDPQSASTPLHVTTTIRHFRTPSPEKKAFLSTLRPTRRQRKSEPSPTTSGAAATTAATLAWSSISRAEGLTLARTLLVPSVDTHTPEENLAASASTGHLFSRQRLSSATANRKPSPRIFQAWPSPSNTKPSAPSSISPLGSSLYPTFQIQPPAPPPHRYLAGCSCAASPEPPITLQNERVSYCSSCSSNTAITPIPPPMVPPKLNVKPPKFCHTNLPLLRKPTSEATLRSEFPTDNSRISSVVGSRSQPTKNPSSEDLNNYNHQSPKEEQEKCGADLGRSSNIVYGDLETEVKERVAKALEALPKGVDMQAALQVANDIVVQGDEVHWNDVAGLDAAKLALKEAVVYPFLRPDLFSGLREPARGMLLFGPPGTGKTMLARAVATESKSTFFSISASSLTSKYLGESEKLVRALFALAKALAPSIIFVDEIDSLLSSRNGNGEHEATRRIKTEFLIQWSDLARAAAGKETSGGDTSRVLVLAATNLPWAIDDAARRRFVRRQYIPLPEGSTREIQLLRLLRNQKYQLDQKEMMRLIELTDGFSGSDITALAKDAAMGPLRSIGEALLDMKKDDIRPINFSDFKGSLSSIKPSVSKEGLQVFEDWAKKYGELV